MGSKYSEQSAGSAEMKDVLGTYESIASSHARKFKNGGSQMKTKNLSAISSNSSHNKSQCSDRRELVSHDIEYGNSQDLFWDLLWFPSLCPPSFPWADHRIPSCIPIWIFISSLQNVGLSNLCSEDQDLAIYLKGSNTTLFYESWWK